MKKTDAERRAFLKTLKPRLIEIGLAAAERSGPIDAEELHERVAAARRSHGQPTNGSVPSRPPLVEA